MALTLLPYPDGITWSDWLDTVVGFNDDLVSSAPSDDDWTDFARRLIQVEPLAPPPEPFEAWQEWVRALKQALDV